MKNLYQKYVTEMNCILMKQMMTYEEFSDCYEGKLEEFDTVMMEENEELKGIMHYVCWEENDIQYCYIPTYGYYADCEKTLISLFMKLSEQVVEDKTCEFIVRLYAHDEESIRAFHMMQFGTMSETGVRQIEEKSLLENEIMDRKTVEDALDIRVLSKDEVEQRWEEIWGLTEKIIEHLKSAPIFYPGDEFTEDVYREFFLDDSTEVIGAFVNGQMVGIIEWNKDEHPLGCGKKKAANVGEAYVMPEYRKSGISTALLAKAEKQAQLFGAKRLWVEHGTANPNARGFWNKYFDTFEYELVRTIKR